MRQFQQLDITTFESHEKILDPLLPGGLFAAQKTKRMRSFTHPFSYTLCSSV